MNYETFRKAYLEALDMARIATIVPANLSAMRYWLDQAAELSDIYPWHVTRLERELDELAGIV